MTQRWRSSGAGQDAQRYVAGVTGAVPSAGEVAITGPGGGVGTLGDAGEAVAVAIVSVGTGLLGWTADRLRPLRCRRSPLTSMGLGAGRIHRMALRPSRRSQAQASCAASRLSTPLTWVASNRTRCSRRSCASGVKLASPCGRREASSLAAFVFGRGCVSSGMSQTIGP